MSRSRHKTPKINAYAWYTNGASSEKEYKRLWHRQMRAITRHRLRDPDLDAILLPLDKKEVGNDRDVGKNGRRLFDPREHPEWMRK